ncbi:MAG: biopolymer transporter ExbD [Akkermansiaceae bacterium]|jgi:biopolymer transport protein ExbD|nr:biopolymer transporter ExbD [Akkermansiaceae bacterium]MCU0777064.1 biopolymer transporter ExbD [Akkermansiaceae bacterium]
MKFSSRQPEPAGMQLAPMIDIVFLLLIFFIVTWQFSRSETELNVSVPTAEEGAELTRPKGEIIINVLGDGVIRVEGSTVDLPQLHDKLAAIARQFENQPVRIRGDGSVAYQRIVEVIDTCQKAGIWNISFATQRPTPAE